jgi:hypothetical protein
LAENFGFWLQRFSYPEIGHKLLEMTQGSTGESYTVSYQDFSAKMHDGKNLAKMTPKGWMKFSIFGCKGFHALKLFTNYLK